ncbi:MAG: hypothetical protein E7376_01425 [Clostridiales bacterium]|nr:hypothetical protein [Clostridiales bacterium]
MKYDLSKLSKEEICTLLTSISPSFTGVYCYAPSQRNKIVKVATTDKKGIIELYDDERKIHDLWGEYNKQNNSLCVMAWDHVCFWPVTVYLYENCFKIPKYKHSIIQYETKSNFDKYTKILEKIFSKKRDMHSEVER